MYSPGQMIELNETNGMKNEQKTVMNYSKGQKLTKHLTRFIYSSFKKCPFGGKIDYYILKYFILLFSSVYYF